jgi:hypothetical protein
MKEDLMFCHLGNGVTVFDKQRRKYGDYMKVAHISYNRKIQYYEPLSDAAMERIENFAKNDNMTVSVTQPYPVLEPIINK